MSIQQRFCLGLTATLISSLIANLAPAFALPPPEDEPEERLRTEIILEARSPLNGEPMTAAEYAELEAKLEAESRNIGIVSQDVRRLIGLLRLRKAIRSILPFF